MAKYAVGYLDTGGLPSPATPGIQLHELLRPASTPQFYYDLSTPPTSAILHDSRFTHTPLPRTFAAAATHPPLTYLRITIMLPVPGGLTVSPLTFPIMVHNLRGVTVFDVLSAVYRALRAPVLVRESSGCVLWEEADYLNLMTPPPTPIPLRAHSFQGPWSVHQHLEGAEEVPVPVARRKIDYLRGRTSFVGLVPGPEGWESWILRTTD